MAGRLALFDTGYQSVSAVQDLLELKLAAGQTAVLHSVRVMQSSLETSTSPEQVQINLKRAGGSYTAGSGGGTATAVKFGSSVAQAHGLATANRNNTTQAAVGTGTFETLWPGVFSELAGEWEFTPVPEDRPEIVNQEAFILSLDEAPAAARTLRAIALIEIKG